MHESVRSEWFDKKVFNMKRIKHASKIKKDTPPEDSIACLKCNSVFETSKELTKNEKKCYKKYSYPCDDDKCEKTF